MAMSDDELRALAEAATKGKWQSGVPSDSIVVPDTHLKDHHDTREYYGGHLVCESVAPNDKAFIIAASPATIISLLDRLAVLRGDRR